MRVEDGDARVRRTIAAPLLATLLLTGCEPDRVVTVSLPGHAETRLTHCPTETGEARIFAADASRAVFRVSVWQLVEGGRTRLGRLDNVRDAVWIGRLRRGTCVGLVLSNDGARGLRSLTVQLTSGE